MVFSLAFALAKDCYVATEDRNSGRSVGNHDEVAYNAYSESDLRGTIDSLSVTEPLLRIAKLEERQGE